MEGMALHRPDNGTSSPEMVARLPKLIYGKGEKDHDTVVKEAITRITTFDDTTFDNTTVHDETINKVALDTVVAMSETGAADAPQKSTDTTCHLLRLRGELRNRIFELSIASEGCYSGHVGIESRISKGRLLRRACPQPPALASTCKQVRHELLSALYGGRKIMLSSYTMQSEQILKLFAGTSRSWFPYLRHITITIYARKIEIAYLSMHVAETEKLVVNVQNHSGEPVAFCTCGVSRHAA
ncbi:uncharacterized protein LTR77_007786 [Saxophila tyrrhenica]|uniref:Uncharacterized protein n=1 Tax=Saxophila tyrrhenica TaxID=1690608 RepID=A0AAV9P3I5_9PEZI|nr:hypothetical protein LTR77_007786 [Saxophila tyrrhenica]